MILGRIEDTLETSQPEEQHGFRSKRRIEEHLLTFNVILDKTLEMDQPLWIISLDLSKAFDRVNWESLWQAVGAHGVSQHLVWILQVLYYQQRGTIVGSMENSVEFDIAAGVRQGCVLSPRLFCSVLEWALSKWRAQLNGVGYNFQDEGVSLLDLRFADDILIFAKSYEEISWSCSERWEDKNFDDAEPTPSRTCITWRDSCGDFGTRPCAQVVGLYDKHSHGWQPRT